METVRFRDGHGKAVKQFGIRQTIHRGGGPFTPVQAETAPTGPGDLTVVDRL